MPFCRLRALSCASPEPRRKFTLERTSFIVSGVHSHHTFSSSIRSLRLYADLGHFGYKAITLAWTLVVFPALTIQYYGQCCHVISLGRDTSLYPSSDYETAEYQALVQERQLYNTKLIEVPNDLVYALIPTDAMPYMAGQACLWLLTILAVLAAIIASQALISGLFSILTQAYALDIVPRLTISHTNPDEKGQVYISEANSMMCVVCILIVLVFQSSEKLLSAYGIAVAFCMFLTDLSMVLVVVWVYKYHWAVAVLVCVPFILVDGLFLASNSVKLSHGTESWLTIVITLVLWFFMQAHWWTKTAATRTAQAAHAHAARRMSNQEVTTADIENLISLLKDSKVLTRMPVAGVFLTNLPETPPLSLSIFARSMAALPDTIILLNISLSHAKPFVSERERYDLHCHSEELGLYSLTMHFGYCEPITSDYFDVNNSLQDIFHSEGYIALEKLTEDTTFHRSLRESTRCLMMPNDDSPAKCSPGSAHRWTYILGVRHYVPHAKEGLPGGTVGYPAQPRLIRLSFRQSVIPLLSFLRKIA
jgi:KUP system potassium uptake protein